MIVNDPRNTRNALYGGCPHTYDRSSGSLVAIPPVLNLINEGIHFHWTKNYLDVAASALADPGFFWPSTMLGNAYLAWEIYSTGAAIVELWEDASADDTSWLTGQAICNRRISEGTLNTSDFQVRLNAGSATGSATKLCEGYIGSGHKAPGEMTGVQQMVCKTNVDTNPQLHYYLKVTSQGNGNNISIALGWGEVPEKE